MPTYNQIAASYNELYGEEQLNKLLIIKNNIKINKSTKILDVGCGTGISSSFDCFVIGIDPSAKLLRQNVKPLKVLGAAESLPFKNNEFDFVISITAIHNFNDIKKSIDEIKRVGNKNFVLTVLKNSRKFSLIRGLIRKNFKVEKMIEEDKDLIFFCKKP